MLQINSVNHGDSAILLKQIPDNYIDLTVTSPPYDDLRSYEGYSFDFESIAKELYRSTKEGGVVVWIVKDSIITGSESGTSFEQALYFKKIGFKLHDTMIYSRPARFPEKSRYSQCFEYMFVFSKGKPKTTNIINDHENKPDSHKGGGLRVSIRKKDGTRNYVEREIPRKLSNRWNIWHIQNGYLKSTKDKIAYEHPAIMPESLACDHIKSWSNKGDLVLDPFAGSGTTLKMAKQLDRDFIGIEISEKYCNIIKKRCNISQCLICEEVFNVDEQRLEHLCL